MPARARRAGAYAFDSLLKALAIENDQHQGLTMAGSISIKRAEKGKYNVYKLGAHVADIFRSRPSEMGHNPAEPWLLKTLNGRIDRFATKGDAADDALKL